MLKFSHAFVCVAALGSAIGIAYGQGGGTGTTGSSRIVGFIGSLPASGQTTGTWTVAGSPVNVTSTTTLNTTQGQFTAGGCVEVIGAPGTGTTTGFTATSVRSLPASQCGGANANVLGLQLTGPLGTFPSGGGTGTWQVGGRDVTVGNNTNLNQFRGPFTTGSCVRVVGAAAATGGAVTANQVELISGIGGCSFEASTTPNNVTFRGLVQQISTLGQWTVAGRTVTTNASTNLNPTNYTAVQGDCVEIQGVLDNNGLVTAASVQRLGQGACANAPAAEDQLRFTGQITSVPAAGQPGNWTVGNFTIQPTNDTWLGGGPSDFVVGTCVEVQGTFANNVVTASRIRPLPATQCPTNQPGGTVSFFGPVTGTPGSAPTGNFTIAGRTVNVSSQTGVAEQLGEFGLGSCVQVTGIPGTGDNFNATQVNVLSAGGSCLYSTGGVLSAASFTGTAVAPGQIVSLFGLNLGPAGSLGTQVSGGVVTSRLGNTRVLFDGTPAPLLLVTPNQINAVVPCNVAGRTTTQVQVESNGIVTNVLSLPVSQAAPAIFTVNNTGRGGGAVLNYNAQTGAYTVNSSQNAIQRGGIISIYFTGLGATTPACSTGQVIPNDLASIPRPSTPVTVTIGGQQAEVLFVGGAPGAVWGVWQANVRVPQGVTPGPAVPLVISTGTQQSQAGVTIAVQ